MFFAIFKIGLEAAVKQTCKNLAGIKTTKKSFRLDKVSAPFKYDHLSLSLSLLTVPLIFAPPSLRQLLIALFFEAP